MGEEDDSRGARRERPAVGAREPDEQPHRLRRRRGRRRSSVSRGRARTRRPSPTKAQPRPRGGRGRRRAGCTRARSAKRLYARASCAYQTRNGWTLTRAAATRPARRETNSAACAVRDGDDRRADERRERAQSDLSEAGEPRPGPREHVVEVRRRLAVRDRAEHVVEVLAQERHGDELVEPEALAVECGEAKVRPDAVSAATIQAALRPCRRMVRLAKRCQYPAATCSAVGSKLELAEAAHRLERAARRLLQQPPVLPDPLPRDGCQRWSTSPNCPCARSEGRAAAGGARDRRPLRPSPRSACRSRSPARSPTRGTPRRNP